MKDGRWLEPRYTDKAVFEKDFPAIDLNALECGCPGCKSGVKMVRKSSLMKIAGWCKTCNRAVTV